MDWLDLLAVQGTLKSLLQHHSSKASILRRSAFFTVQLSHPYMTIGKTIALTRRTFVGKVMSLLFNMLSRLVITFLPLLGPHKESLAVYFTHGSVYTSMIPSQFVPLSLPSVCPQVSTLCSCFYSCPPAPILDPGPVTSSISRDF